MLSPSVRVEAKNGVYLGASLAYRLININDGLQDAWLEMTGRTEREDLSNVLRVQMGLATEKFNSEWYCKQTGFSFADNDAWRKPWRDKMELETQHKEMPWLLSHPDQWRIDDKTGEIVLIDFKHTNQDNYNRQFKVEETYQPQMQMQMLIASSAFGVPVNRSELSVFFGNGNWSRIEIKAEPHTQQQLLKLYVGFYQHVMNDESPDESWQPDIELPKVMPFKIRNLELDNEFAVLAEEFVKTKADAKAHSDVKQLLKGKLQEDDKEIYNDFVRVSRSPTNRISIKEVAMQND